MAHYQGVPVTPFSDFCKRVDALSDSDLAHNLREWEPSHQISLALNQLSSANAYLRSQCGISGPLRPWNRPTSPRPHHAHLSPGTYRPSSPYTPPRTPTVDAAAAATAHALEVKLDDVNRQLAQCKKLLASAQSEVASQRATLAASNKTVQEQEATLSTNTSTIKSLRQRLAEQYLAVGKNSAAEDQYAKLEDLQKQEAKQRRSWHDRSGARAAEARELEFELAKGRALLNQEKYKEAEAGFRHVLRRRKELFVDEGVTQAETREAQLFLCEVLRKSGKDDQMWEAEGLHLRSEPLVGLDTMSEADREWSLTNIVTLAQLYAEQKGNRLAVSKLSNAWRWRHVVARSFRETMEDKAFTIIGIFEKRGEAAAAAKTFEVVYPDRVAALSGNALATAARLGVELYNQGGNDEKATSFLKQTWSQRRNLDESVQRTIGWTLAIIHIQQSRWNDVHDLIMEFPPRRPGSPTSDPSDDAVLALLAYTQLNLGNIAGAEKNSRALYTKHGVNNVSSGFRWHHADTLIRALTKQRDEKKGHYRFFEAKDVWSNVYDATLGLGLGGLSDSARKDLRRHADAGVFLASEWRDSCEKRLKKPKSADEVMSQAETMKRLAR
ncbi:uncharacterized protein HMPREF1541_02399 [Cyphellophora europaea CBS 101466]|uniref:Uncharacterized protein n=1 Tax=Cyphellophora europaea (strain CBS 101466) TaxID=1220924 RepID=W2S3R2_CYPE1|nr:uncharacterized protein HMPREF1541_02399 [Cyphellophora europaea CBS 101466]ETN43240.1 hypothetical protein HMPREF1541_02399 [Cyphellophora europaea CBS 101466]